MKKFEIMEELWNTNKRLDDLEKDTLPGVLRFLRDLDQRLAQLRALDRDMVTVAQRIALAVDPDDTGDVDCVENRMDYLRGYHAMREEVLRKLEEIGKTIQEDDADLNKRIPKDAYIAWFRPRKANESPAEYAHGRSEYFDAIARGLKQQAELMDNCPDNPVQSAQTKQEQHATGEETLRMTSG